MEYRDGPADRNPEVPFKQMSRQKEVQPQVVTELTHIHGPNVNCITNYGFALCKTRTSERK